MNLAEVVAPHLPYLRRFSRSLTGSQASGDAYVAAMLEALVADRSIFPEHLDPKVALYSVFSRMWRSVDINLHSLPETVDPWEAQARKSLKAIAPLPRQAFLLMAVERFSHAEGATILGVSEGEFAELIDQASRDMAQQVATDIMIIEDEPLIAMDIEQMVESLGHTVTGVARTHSEALKLFNERRPGLVLADIQLADGSSGIDAVNDILQKVSVPVIFITAFPERLLTGERPEPAFLVTKPFQPDMVKALVSQVLFFSEQIEQAA
ncbi:response regulator [Pelagibacterium lentulum]|uniref:Two-component response regulator n=1 Tax=Pelagibacterium lentulum TaxID=2029865 RepID=A0A916VWW2_9HYPH|nr:response regulator [Pelagibacterium lentulum]GGA46422.1 two-component response regulator [Pelagibacterium lentulum]